jgi:hypothetical protein
MALSRMLGKSVVFFNASTKYVKVRGAYVVVLAFNESLMQDHQIET